MTLQEQIAAKLAAAVAAKGASTTTVTANVGTVNTSSLQVKSGSGF